MVRFRFHGRGGHGMKTASRILGTAAFLSGLQAQDSPVYGAERRGAAMAAFTRIGTEPIQERGIIPDPDVILVSDETLLEVPSAGVLAGQEGAAVLFVNSARGGSEIAERFGVRCPVCTLDLTTLASERLGQASALSALMGAVACGLAGGISEALLEQAVRAELGELLVEGGRVEENVRLAREVFARTAPLPTHARGAPAAASAAMHTPGYVDSPAGAPVIYHTGSSGQRRTGSWRLSHPAVDRDACSRCLVCLACCPDSAISVDGEGYPVIDLANCKGCMICRQECPLHCIVEEKEVHS